MSKGVKYKYIYIYNNIKRGVIPPPLKTELRWWASGIRA
jgi:hypothetical protein